MESMTRQPGRCMEPGKKMRRFVSLLAALGLCLGMGGRREERLPLTPENILDSAFLQDRDCFCTAFSLAEREYSAEIIKKGEVLRVFRPAVIDGRTADEFFVEFWDRGMIAATYRFYFVEAEGEAFADAWRYAIRRQEELSERYGASIYDSYYGFIPSSQLGEAAKTQEEAADYFAEKGRSLTDVFCVSEDCAAEVILMSTPGERSLVSLKCHIYPEQRELAHSQESR